MLLTQKQERRVMERLFDRIQSLYSEKMLDWLAG